MTSVDFHANRYETGKINFPASVHAGGGLGQHHADAAVEKPKWLPGAVGHRHSKNDVLRIDRYNLDAKSLDCCMGDQRAHLFECGNQGDRRSHSATTYSKGCSTISFGRV